MVEELKLAIKIDDASIEQPLLKQFANAQKMADKVVLDFKNVNFDDKQIEAKFKEMQKKAGQNPIDLSISGNTLDMLGQIDKRLTEIFSIGKGKSFIDSSSTVADIGKIENKINELNKKYEEAQKKISSIGSGNVSGKDINLVDNAEFQKLSDSFEKIKGEVDDLKTHMSLLDGSVVSGEQFIKLGEQVEGLSVKFDTLIDKYVELSNAQKALSSTSQESNISSGMKDAFPKTSENLEQVAQSEQKVQQEAVVTDKALDNISFTPNTEGFEDIIAKFGILREQAEQITKIVKATKQTADGADISYKATLKNGSSYYLGENSTPQVLNASETVYDAKADNAKRLEREKQIWNELTTSLDRYATLQKRIASNNALSTDNEEATKLLEHIHELQRNDILPTEKLTASNEKLQQINQTVTDLKAKLKESTLDSLQGSIDKYHKIYNQRSTYSSDFTPSEQYTKNLNELETAIGNLVEYKNTLKNVSEVTVEQEAELKRLVAACEKASDSFKSLSASEKGASQIAVDKLVQRINKDLDECTNYSENAKHELMALREELESANPRNLKEITSEIINIENAEIRAGRAGRTLWDTMKHSGFHQIAAQMAGMVGVYDVINAGKEGINVVRELNTALTEMQKVSDETKQKLKDYQSTTFNTADAVGTTAKQIQTSTADWMRLGESIDEAASSAKTANVLLNVSEFDNIEDATKSLVAMGQAYKDLDKMTIVDKLNEVGKIVAQTYSNVWCYKNIAW